MNPTVKVYMQSKGSFYFQAKDITKRGSVTKVRGSLRHCSVHEGVVITGRRAMRMLSILHAGGKVVEETYTISHEIFTNVADVFAHGHDLAKVKQIFIIVFFVHASKSSG
jgi:hypothetical protein